MWPRLIVFRDPGIQIGLQLVDRTIHMPAIFGGLADGTDPLGSADYLVKSTPTSRLRFGRAAVPQEPDPLSRYTGEIDVLLSAQRHHTEASAPKS
jgi:hypothetical protein